MSASWLLKTRFFSVIDFFAWLFQADSTQKHIFVKLKYLSSRQAGEFCLGGKTTLLFISRFFPIPVFHFEFDFDSFYIEIKSKLRLKI